MGANHMMWYISWPGIHVQDREEGPALQRVPPPFGERVFTGEAGMDMPPSIGGEITARNITIDILRNTRRALRFAFLYVPNPAGMPMLKDIRRSY